MKESELTPTSEVNNFKFNHIGLGLDDSLEPRKVSQGMVGQVSIGGFFCALFSLMSNLTPVIAKSKKVSWYHPYHDQRSQNCR